MTYDFDYAPVLARMVERFRAARRPQQIGAAGEGIVEVYHAVARARGVADLFKVPTPTARRDGAIVYGKRSVTDFVGVMLGSGKHVAEEVKSVAEWPLAASAVKGHQRGYLDRTLAAGGVAVLTVVGPDGGVYVIPWSVAKTMRSIRAPEVWLRSPVAYLLLSREESLPELSD